MGQLLGGVAVLVGVVAGAAALPKVWRPVRRLVTLVDTLAGRPPRYPGDREARPGLAERLDRIESRQEQVVAELAGLREQMCQTTTRLTRVEMAMNGWLAGVEPGRTPARHSGGGNDHDHHDHDPPQDSGP